MSNYDRICPFVIYGLIEYINDKGGYVPYGTLLSLLDSTCNTWDEEEIWMGSAGWLMDQKILFEFQSGPTSAAVQIVLNYEAESPTP
jgi:hypothetical protein